MCITSCSETTGRVLELTGFQQLFQDLRRSCRHFRIFMLRVWKHQDICTVNMTNYFSCNASKIFLKFNKSHICISFLQLHVQPNSLTSKQHIWSVLSWKSLGCPLVSTRNTTPHTRWSFLLANKIALSFINIYNVHIKLDLFHLSAATN